jgi:hypothetical protein
MDVAAQQGSTPRKRWGPSLNIDKVNDRAITEIPKGDVHAVG